MKLEKAIEDEFVKKAGGYNVIAVKFNLAGNRNWPDRQVLLGRGYIFWVEFKRSASHTPRKGQLSNHKKLRARGYNVYVLWDIDTAMDILELEIMNNG